MKRTKSPIEHNRCIDCVFLSCHIRVYSISIVNLYKSDSHYTEFRFSHLYFSYYVPVSSKKFLDIQPLTEYRFTLNSYVRHGKNTQSMHHADKYPKHN